MTSPVAVMLPQPPKKQLLRVGFLSSLWCSDYVGLTTLDQMKQALIRRGLQVFDIGQSKSPIWQQKLLAFKQKVQSRLGFSDPDPLAEHQRFMTKVHRSLNQLTCDVVFAPAATAEVARLQTRLPIVYLSDSTLKLKQRHGELLSEPMGLARTRYYEITAIAKSSRILYPSEYVAYSAVEDYGASYKKISVIPFGANITTPPSLEALLAAKQSSSTSPVRLLWIGTGRFPQEGMLAFQTLLCLLAHGIHAELTVIGGEALAEMKHDKLTVVPALDSTHTAQQQRRQLFQQAHFFLMPTWSQGNNTLISEANAFGLPILSAQIGGAVTAIKDGRNGYTLPISATARDYARLIIRLWQNSSEYERLVSTCREEYDQHLNWNKWAERCHHVLADLHNSTHSQGKLRSKVERF